MRSLRPIFAKTLSDLGAVDENLVVIVGDISHGLLGDFRNSFPSRYFNIGICEPAMVGVAAGMSKIGLNPVIHTIAPFLIERAYEQIKLDFGYQQISGNFVSVGSAFDYSKLGCSHHSYADVSLIPRHSLGHLKTHARAISPVAVSIPQPRLGGTGVARTNALAAPQTA